MNTSPETTQALETIAKAFGAPVTIEPCGNCGRQVAIHKVLNASSASARVELRCHGESATITIRPSDGATRIIPFANPHGLPPRPRGITTGPFGGGIIR